jgi:hypothetical protein
MSFPTKRSIDTKKEDSMIRAVLPYSQTSSVAVALSAGGDFGQLTHVQFTADADPTTSENMTITLDSHLGSAYDFLLHSVDLSADSDPDNYIWQPSQPMWVHCDDRIVIAFANTDTNACSVAVYFKPA